MIAGVGLDLCGIERISKAIEKEHFLERVYTERERARILEAKGVRKGEIAAGLFAVKEAVAKALGTGFNGFGPEDIEVVPDELGCPVCTLYKKAAELAGRRRVHVSITHESGMAAAVAILEADHPGGHAQYGAAVLRRGGGALHRPDGGGRAGAVRCDH